MRKKIYLSFLLLIYLMSFSLVLCQDNFKKVGQSGMQYLKIGVGADMVGKGEAGIADVNGLSAMFWNQAGLAELEGTEFMFTHNAWIADISLNAVGVGLDLDDWGVVGFNILWMDYGELYKTSVATTTEESALYGYVDEGTFSPSDIAISAAYSRKVSDQFSFGGQIRYLYQNYGSNITLNEDGDEEHTDNVMSAFCFDFGTRYNSGFKSLAIAMAIQNFSKDLKYQQEAFSAPLTFKIGVSMNLLDFYNESTKNKLNIAIDAIHPRDYSERLNFGLEFDYLGLFQIRGGYRMNYDMGNFTTGAGIRYSLSNNMGIKFDVSYIIENSGRFTSPLQLTARLIMF